MVRFSTYKKWMVLASLLVVLLQTQAAIVYQYGFENLCGNLCTFASPWTGTPDVLATGLSNSSWATDYSGGFISYAGSCGGTTCQALSISHNIYPANTTYTLTLTVNAGYTLNITGISYWDRESVTGPTNTTITVNGSTAFNNIALQGTAGANTGLMPATYNNITGTVTLVMTLTGATSANGTFRLDDFVIEGTVASSSTPAVFNVTGGGGYCPGSSGAIIGLSGSEVGVTYQLVSGGNNIGNPVSGTGSAISFGPQAAAGTYTIVATNTSSQLTANMNGNATIVIYPAPTNNLRPLSIQCGGTDTLDAGNPGSYYRWSTNDTTQTIVVSIGAYYDVTVTNSNGCTISWQDTVGIDGVPVSPVINVSNPSICQGSGTMLSVSAGIAFHWSTGDTTSSINVFPLVDTVYSVTVTAASYTGCSSMASTNITVLPVVTSNINAQICPGGNYGGHTSAGNYIDTLTTASGCDSIRTLNLTTGTIVTSTDTAYICSGQTYAGHNSTGTYIDTFTSAGGCDSIRTLNLTLFGTVSSVVSQTICAGQSYAGHTTTGLYADTLSTTHGCDSLAYLNLTVLNSITSSSAQTICPGQSYGGHDSTGIYVDTFQSVQNCDSIVTLNLTVNSVININSAQTICAGQTYGGHNITGIFTDTLQSAGGCDSIVTLNLTVNPVFADSSFMAICHGQSYLGHTTSGIYIDTLLSVGGCDSFSALHLTVHSLPYVSLYLPFDSVCVSTAPFTLSGGTPAGGYYTGQGISAGMFDPNIAGVGKDTVVYVYTDSNNCTRGWYEFMYVDSCLSVGVSELSDAAFMVWPNPATTILNVQMPVDRETYEYKLYDMLGQSAITGRISGNQQITIDLRALQPGIYLLAISSGKTSVYSKKIMKE